MGSAMRFFITFIMLPVRIIVGLSEFGLRFLGFILGVVFRTLRFFSGKTMVLCIGAVIGVLLGRKYLGVKDSIGKK